MGTPATATIQVPALSGAVQVKALTAAELLALRPSPFNPVTYTWAIVEAGTVQPQLDPALLDMIFRRYGEAPIMRIFAGIAVLSGVDSLLTPFVVPSPLRP